ncbi:protein OPI10 homolog [Tachypleus tridentatus]|uniref:protein OPI10 homolog n=1 Tax=Tachypleus tridentatus TaxID=6853 RepID=UPI003FD0EF62
MNAPMFGVIVSGRLVQTDFELVEGTKFLINIPDADNVNHIVVFMTGSQPFPEGLGGAVYFSWPDPNALPSWQFLGHVSNIKPSAIFKIAKLKISETTQHPFGFQQQISHVAQIGISVEPLVQIQGLTPSPAAGASSVDSFSEFATKMLENFFNYASSFAMSQTQMASKPSESFVPLSTLQQWYTNFCRRLQQNPYFWKT